MTFNTSVLHCGMELENMLACTIFTKFTVFYISGEFWKYSSLSPLLYHPTLLINVKIAFSFRT